MVGRIYVSDWRAGGSGFRDFAGRRVLFQNGSSVCPDEDFDSIDCRQLGGLSATMGYF